MSFNLSDKARNIICFALLLCLILAPIVVYCIMSEGFPLSFLLTSLLFAMPLSAVIMAIPRKSIFSVLVVLLAFGTSVEIVMLSMFKNFIVVGNILAVVTTTKGESSNFIEHTLHLLLYLLPVVIWTIATIYFFPASNKKFSKPYLILTALSLVGSMTFIGSKLYFFYHHNGHDLTVRYYLENRVLNRPPYNLTYQTCNAVQQMKIKHDMMLTDTMSFHAYRNEEVPDRECYLMLVGESCRYKSLGINGYNRNTTPALDTIANLISCPNYYSTACLTMYSVPQILTRATPLNYELNYKEKSCFLPFKECGFKTFAICCRNLLIGERYLTNGVDSLFSVENDMDIPRLIDSLSSIYPKTFFIAQMLGNHSFYYNYPPEYDLYHPNINSDPTQKSDSLYINADDNTLLFTDHVLSTICQVMNRPETRSAFLFTSDHGEGISATGGGHGGDCNPQIDEYHVPLLFFWNELWEQNNADLLNNMRHHCNLPINADNVFYSLCSMASIQLDAAYADESYSLFSDNFELHDRYILVPDGKNVVLVE